MLSVARLEILQWIVTALMAIAIPLIAIGAYRSAARADYRQKAREAAGPWLQRISPLYLAIMGFSLIAWGVFLIFDAMPHFRNLRHPTRLSRFCCGRFSEP
jgi:hypothetical protein